MSRSAQVTGIEVVGREGLEGELCSVGLGPVVGSGGRPTVGLGVGSTSGWFVLMIQPLRIMALTNSGTKKFPFFIFFRISNHGG
jgi:hypothetical protein